MRRVRSGLRQGSKAACWSWRDLPEDGNLVKDVAEEGMSDVECEEKAPFAQLTVHYRECTRRHPARERQTMASDAQEIAGAAKDERARFHRDPQRHADAAADMLFEARRPCELLRGMDHLRRALPSGIEPRPELTPA